MMASLIRQIWISPKALTKDDHGSYYTPQQMVRLWFQEGLRTGTVISPKEGATAQQEYDMSDSPTTYFMYDSQYSQWLDPQPTEFPMDQSGHDVHGFHFASALSITKAPRVLLITGSAQHLVSLQPKASKHMLSSTYIHKQAMLYPVFCYLCRSVNCR